MGGNARAGATSAAASDSANDWSGIESAASRAQRRAEFWPQVFSTATRGLFVFWGVGMSLMLVVAIAFGVSILFSVDWALLGWWGAFVLLAIGGAWLAFRIAADMDVEMQDAVGPGPS